MNPEELRQRISERFDDQEDLDVPLTPEETEDWDAWSIIANHLETHEVVAVPEDLAVRVQSTIARTHFRRDLVLVLQVAFVTGMILTFVVAYALGFDWLPRLARLANPAAAATTLHSITAELGSWFATFAVLPRVAVAAWKFSPLVLVSFAILALLAEHTLLWLLHLGPFGSKSKTHSL